MYLEGKDQNYVFLFHFNYCNCNILVFTFNLQHLAVWFYFNQVKNTTQKSLKYKISYLFQRKSTSTFLWAVFLFFLQIKKKNLKIIL